MPKLNIQNSSKKDFDIWKKDVILWYEKNKNNLPSNIQVQRLYPERVEYLLIKE